MTTKLEKGTPARLRNDERTTWHNILNYPPCYLLEDTLVWIVSGPNPYVSKRGTFYLVETEKGVFCSIVAVDAGNLVPLTIRQVEERESMVIRCVDCGASAEHVEMMGAFAGIRNPVCCEGCSR